MPTSQDKTKVLIGVYTITLDGNPFPHFLNMRIMAGYTETPVYSHGKSSTPIGYMVTGHAIEVTMDAQQLSASLSEFLDITSGEPLTVGSFRTEHAVVLHPIGMGEDASQDIIIPKAVFGPTVDSSKDPSNTDKGSILIRGVDNPDGPVWRFGPEPA